MYDTTEIGLKAEKITFSPDYEQFTKVVLLVTDELYYEAGTDTGRELELTCPWGTQQIAQDILDRLRGFVYTPYTADNALLDPAAEIGDRVTIGNDDSGIYNLDNVFGWQYTSSLEAPNDDDIDHEIPYQTGQDRELNRSFANVHSILTVHADQIAARVESTAGDQNFGWDLRLDHWSVIANNREVLRATADGLTVSGRIIADSGTIGGFNIEKNYLSSNGQTWGGSNTSGIYIGPEGIQLGTKFGVSKEGTLYAVNGLFGGNIYCDTLYVSNGRGGYDQVTTSTMNSNLSGGANWNANGATVTSNALAGLEARNILAGGYHNVLALNSGTFVMNGYNVYLGQLYINKVAYNVLRWV